MYSFKIICIFRTCLHKKYVRIFKHILVDVKAKICSWAVALQEFLTQAAAGIAEKTCMGSCEDKFSVKMLL